MFTPIKRGLCLVSLLVSTGLYSEQVFAEQNTNPLPLEKCFVENVKSKALCGTLTVAENRDEPISDDNKIDLNVVVLPKYKEESQQQPVMFLAGGPGQAATELAAVLDRTMYELRQEHDIILVDQRGTGKSSALVCDMEEIESLSFKDSGLDFAEETKRCVEEFSDKHLPSYNTYDSIKDFDAVREALGHDKIHIYGGSYGTRAGFAYLKLFPQSVATAVLDSNAPMELVIGFFGKTSERAFDMLLADCAKLDNCNSAFPELKQDYLTLLAELEKGPIEVPMYHPVSGQKITAWLSKTKVLEALRTTLYNLSSRQMLPYIIHSAANGDYRFLAALIGQSVDSERKDGGLYMGLTMNILCNEDIPRATQKDFEQDKENYFNQELGYQVFTQVCDHWPKWQAPADFSNPVTTDVPVLLVSGDYDPVTPPAYGEMALANLKNAKHLVLKYGSHTASLQMCQKPIKQFIQSGTFEDIDFSCADEPAPMMFLTDINQLH